MCQVSSYLISEIGSKSVVQRTCDSDVVSKNEPVGGRREVAHHYRECYLVAAVASPDNKCSPITHSPTLQVTVSLPINLNVSTRDAAAFLSL